MVGKRWENRSRPVASSQRWSTPCSAMRAAMARLTTSRGASSSTKRSPSRSRSSAPWPRSASESSGRGMAGWCSAVGWNCTNSTSAVGTPGPQRHGHAVAGGLGRVGGDREQLARAAGGQHDVVGPHRHRVAPAGGSSAVTPTQRPPSMRRSRANQPSSTALAEAVGGVDEGPLHLGPRGRARRRAPRGPSSGRPRGRAPAAPSPRGRTRRRARSARGRAPGPRRPGCARPPRRTGRRRRPACRRGAGRSSPRRRRARRRRRPGPSASPTGTARPWSARRGTGRRGRRARPRQPHRGRQPGHPAAQDQDVEGSRPGLAGHAGSVSVSSASRRAEASSITRLRPSTCTTRGTYASSSARS